MDWWESFFDEGYVEAWEASGAFERTAEQAGMLVALLDLPASARILDVACGFGRFTRQLHDRGYDATGIDASEVQLRIARETNPGPRYLRADMRRPPPGPFDAVVNLFSSFGYFEDRDDDLDALRAWVEVLRPGGVLVMELMHRDAVAHHFGREDSGRDDNPVREVGSTDWVTGVRTATVTYGDVSKTFRIRLYTATELVGALRETGSRRSMSGGTSTRSRRAARKPPRDPGGPIEHGPGPRNGNRLPSRQARNRPTRPGRPPPPEAAAPPRRGAGTCRDANPVMLGFPSRAWREITPRTHARRA